MISMVVNIVAVKKNTQFEVNKMFYNLSRIDEPFEYGVCKISFRLAP